MSKIYLLFSCIFASLSDFKTVFRIFMLFIYCLVSSFPVILQCFFDLLSTHFGYLFRLFFISPLWNHTVFCLSQYVRLYFEIWKSKKISEFGSSHYKTKGTTRFFWKSQAKIKE